ncbi:MAG: M48 family metallopeptidase [Cyclobacteriaceae bacterium]
MSKVRFGFLLLILLGGASVLYFLYKSQLHAPLGLSFSPAFQLLGKSTKALSTTLTRVLPINEMDEKEFGETLAIGFLAIADETDKDYVYLNKLIKELSIFSKKDFHYRVFVISTPIPNAFALPGGGICVTKGLMETLKSEAQIVSVLSHEIGHIERGHCFEAIKYELTFNKINSPAIGQLADFTFNIFMRHSFSKTQENDADEYGYRLLLQTKYDPMAFSAAFVELQKAEGNAEEKYVDIFSDYFDTHPPLRLRILKFSSMASAWWIDNNEAGKRYNGIQNFNDRIPLTESSFSEEWIINN